VKSGFSRFAGLPACFLLATVMAGAEEELPEITVHAYRTSVLPSHFAGNATVIDEEEITESGLSSVTELLAVKGGVRLTSTSGNAAGSALHMRGFGENSSSRVLVLVDGRPVNRPDMGAVSLMDVPLSRVARVEILRGAQTARFGDNAVGGVINLVTKEASEKGSGYIETAGGDDGYALFRTGYGARYAGDGIRVDLERNFSDGWRENAANEVESAYIRWDRLIGREMGLDFGFGWSDEFTGFPGPLNEARYLDDPRQSIYTQYGQGDQYFSEQTQWKADGTLTLGRTTDWKAELPVSWTRRDQAWNFGPGSHTDNILDSLTVRPSWRWERNGLSIQAALGGRYDMLDLEQFSEIQRKNRIATAELSRWVYGGSLSADWEPWKRWHFGAAARVEGSEVDAHSRNLWEDSLNFDRGGSDVDQAFQAGARWEGETLSGWLRYDRLYRLPSTDEIASYQGYPLSEPFNDQLKAETGDQVELGGEWTRDGWRLRVNGFVQWLQGEIAYDYLRNLNVNLADTRRIGVETELAYESGPFDITLRHTWLDARFESGEYEGKAIYLVPEHEFSAVAGWRPHEQWLVQGEYQYVGASFEGNDFENERPQLPSYGTGNLMIRWQARNGLSIYGRVNNLTDERYATVKYFGVWYPAAGRQYQVGIRKEF
jgi:iron complex outermembrane receptor protein